MRGWVGLGCVFVCGNSTPGRDSPIRLIHDWNLSPLLIHNAFPAESGLIGLYAVVYLLVLIGC